MGGTVVAFGHTEPMGARTAAERETALGVIRESPSDAGTVELIVRRPAVDKREVIEEGRLDTSVGLVGDTWEIRGSNATEDGAAHPDAQVTLMNASCIAVLAGDRERWSLAGDQLYVDLDLSVSNLPAGTRLGMGSAVLEVTNKPHTGCAKFSERFGAEALRFVMSPTGKDLRLRGVNTKVVVTGVVRRGDVITRLD